MNVKSRENSASNNIRGRQNTLFASTEQKVFN